jgi:hypothetical protein
LFVVNPRKIALRSPKRWLTEFTLGEKPLTLRRTSLRVSARWSSMTLRGTTWIDCGMSRSGASILVAVLAVGGLYGWSSSPSTVTPGRGMSFGVSSRDAGCASMARAVSPIHTTATMSRLRAFLTRLDVMTASWTAVSRRRPCGGSGVAKGWRAGQTARVAGGF